MGDSVLYGCYVTLVSVHDNIEEQWQQLGLRF
jgi:hypothetical protein